MCGVINRREPSKVHRENYNYQNTRKKWWHRIPNHRNKCTRLIKYGILAIGRINANRNSNQNAHDIGNANNPKGLRNTLDHNFHHRTAGLPRNHAQFTFRKRGAEHVVDENLRFDPKELYNPFPEPNMHGLPQSQCKAHFFLYFLGNC